ncbi:5477_t:CDS:2, partial [Dentiscutata heterogama]
EEINKYARVLGSYFHPDRTKNLSSPFGLQGIYKSQLEDDVNDYEKCKNDLWKIAIDYHNASKGQWSKLKVLKEDDIKKLSNQELKDKSIYTGELTYHQYRAACKITDKNKLLKKQVKLRGYMALCQYFLKNFLSVQLYALAAIHLQAQNKDNFTLQKLNEAKKIFDKVNGKREEREKREKEKESSVSLDSPDLNTDIKLDSKFNNAMILIGTKDQMISFNNRRIIQNSINKDLENMASKLLIEADRNLVCYESSYKEILRTRKHANMNIFKGSVTITGGIVGGGAAILGAGVNIYEAVAVSGFTSLGGPLLFAARKVGIVLGIYCGYTLIAYDKKEYQEFINALSEEYDENNHISLIVCHNKINKLKGIDDIVDKLMKHDFRSDGIAYLLVLLREVLCSRETKINGIHADFKTQAKRCFEEALNDDLVKTAKK